MINPRAALAHLPNTVWLDWLEYFARHEPIDRELRADRRMARLAAIIANAFRKKGARRFKEDDFMLLDETTAAPARKPSKPVPLWDKIRVYNQLLGGTFVDNRPLDDLDD